MTTQPQLSIIIVNYNAGPFLPKNLDSLKTQLRNLEHEVIVVDNASSDKSMEWVRQNHPEVKCVLNRANLGFAAAVNQGIREAKGEFTLWLNPDSELLDSGFETLIQYMKTHPEIGIAGPQILNPDGSVQLSCRSFPSHETALFNRYSLLTRLFPANPFSRKYLKTDWDHREISEVDWVSGACLLHRRELLKETGGLDETFFMYCEDVDFCLRAKKAGWKTVYHPGAKVLHHIGGSSRQVPRRMIIERHKSMWRYYKKHYPRNIFVDAVTLGVIVMRGVILGLINSKSESRNPKEIRNSNF
jgi:hypothetical protein